MKKQEITFDRFIRISATILLIIVVFYLVNYLSGVLLPFFIAWLFAYLLYPLVKFVQYKMHVRVRALAIIITMLAVLGIMAGVVYAIIPSMIEQIDKNYHIYGQVKGCEKITTLVPTERKREEPVNESE